MSQKFSSTESKLFELQQTIRNAQRIATEANSSFASKRQRKPERHKSRIITIDVPSNNKLAPATSGAGTTSVISKPDKQEGPISKPKKQEEPLPKGQRGILKSKMPPPSPEEKITIIRWKDPVASAPDPSSVTKSKKKGTTTKKAVTKKKSTTSASTSTSHNIKASYSKKSSTPMKKTKGGPGPSNSRSNKAKLGKNVTSREMVALVPSRSRSGSTVRIKESLSNIESKETLASRFKTSFLKNFPKPPKLPPELRVCNVLPLTPEWNIYWETYNSHVDSYKESVEQYTKNASEFSEDFKEYSKKLCEANMEDLMFQAQVGLKGKKKAPIIKEPLTSSATLVGGFVIQRIKVTKRGRFQKNSPIAIFLTTFDHETFQLEITTQLAGVAAKESGPPPLTETVKVNHKLNILSMTVTIPEHSASATEAGPSSALSNLYQEELRILMPPEKNLFTDLSVSKRNNYTVFINGK